ncbi:hypothetical protein [Herbiconiux sp. YIM B11900]|uniref:hypothetical protein n=1 Tax=Herbiconiux sp. YIM B11900 TaxID=3404131 RepID=UPI003F845F08
MSKMSWRNPNTTDALYLNQIAAWGYSLSEVEQIITEHEKNRAAARAEQAVKGEVHPDEVAPDDTGDDFEG